MAVFGDGKIQINDDALVLHTGLTEREAAHIKLMQSLNEEGTVISKQEDGSFLFTPYSFNNSYTAIEIGSKIETVFVSGPAVKGIPFFELLKTDDNGKLSNKTQAIKALNTLSEAVEYAFENSILLPNAGPFGTIVLEDNSLLILPYTLFDRSMMVGSDAEYSKYVGCFKNPALAAIDSWRFTLSVYAYIILSGKQPFPNKDTESRKADYFDFNFIPLEWLIKYNNQTEIQNIEKTFNIITNNFLVIAPEAIKKSKRNKYAKPKSKSLPQIKDYGEPDFLTLEENALFNKKAKKLKTKRFLRKHSTAINVSGICLAIILAIVAVTIFDKSDVPTTKGKTPIQVVEMFYDAYQKLSLEQFDATITKGTADAYKAMITNLYVTSRVRESYENDKTTFTAIQWLNTSEPWTRWIFGITNLHIFDVEIFENEDSMTATAKASYYKVWTDAGNEVFCTDVLDTISLVYKKDMWKIDNVQIEQTELCIDSEQFFADLQEITNSVHEIPTVNNYDGSIIVSKDGNIGLTLVKSLKDKYPWLPTEAEIETGRKELIEKYKKTMAIYN